MSLRSRVHAGPWIVERIQIAFFVALVAAVVLILATGWGMA